MNNRESAMDSLSARELLDTVRRYYYTPLPSQQLEDPDIFERLQSTPEFQAWSAAREDAKNRWPEWNSLVKKLDGALPEFSVRNESMPGMSCYEAEVWPDDPLNPRDPMNPKPPEDGAIVASLVVRVSYFAPVYEMYESSAQAVYRPGARVDEQGQTWPTYINQRRTHTISPALRPAADAFARAIEAHYEYQLVDPELLDIQLINTAIWEDRFNRGTLGEALFSYYRL